MAAQKKVRMDHFTERLHSMASAARTAVTMDSMMNDSSVIVCVRIRPFLPHDSGYASKTACLELESGSTNVLRCVNIPMNTKTKKKKKKKSVHFQHAQEDHRFILDAVLTEDFPQDEVYNLTARRILVQVLKGYNGTIFAYGQTGSGKTHTMMGENPNGARGLTASSGLLPRVNKELFDKIETSRSQGTFSKSA